MHELITPRVKTIIPFDDFLELNNKYPQEQYKKLASILLLKAAGLPILPGFVIDKLDAEATSLLTDWMTKTNSKRLSFRFDSPLPEDHVRLSSLNPSPEELKKLSPLIKPPVIGLVLAENDRYQQDHSVLTQFLDDRMRCDTVGPGFDAGDITRGKVTPHETIEIVHKTPNCNSELSQLDILSHKITSSEDYQRSRKLRYGGIYSTITSTLGKSVSSQSLGAEETEEVDEFLGKRDAFIPYSYEPLGWERFAKIYSYLVMLDTFRKYYRDSFGIDVNGKVLSASFLKKYGLVFWDLYGGRK